ncbi:hypothetical protein HOLleu_43225 [Holothuria leucospilota]|uniref:Uncharacterized protein n=1 Tax=Holothuria leucospilota TaxID=206669 RepID=A0A9Q0YC14_HOLLE|nr:hypothetical protein HOLleu_43225 [Holothuria leucospilota]
MSPRSANKITRREMTAEILQSLLESRVLRDLICSAVSDSIKSNLDCLKKAIERQEGRIHQLECELEESEKQLKKCTEENTELQSKMGELGYKLNSLEQ